MKAIVERMLGKVFAVKAHEPSPETMTAYERREWEALAAKPHGMTAPLAADTFTARSDAAEAMAPRNVPMADSLADDTEEARAQAEQASVKDGSHLRSEPVDDSAEALAEIRDASPHEAPRSPLVDGSEEARYAAMRASEPSRMGDDDVEEKAEKQD